MLGAAWNGAIYAVGIITIVFAVLERERVRFTALDNWNPARLPTAGDGREVPRSESVIGLVFGFTFLIWWVDLIRVPEFMATTARQSRSRWRRSGRGSTSRSWLRS